MERAEKIKEILMIVQALRQERPGLGRLTALLKDVFAEESISPKSEAEVEEEIQIILYHYALIGESKLAIIPETKFEALKKSLSRLLSPTLSPDAQKEDYLLKEQLKDLEIAANFEIEERDNTIEELKAEIASLKESQAKAVEALEFSNVVIDEAAGSVPKIPNVVAIKWSMCKHRNNELISSLKGTTTDDNQPN